MGNRSSTFLILSILFFSTFILSFQNCGNSVSLSSISVPSASMVKRYSYITDNNGYVWKCFLDMTTGLLSSCATESGVPSGDLGYDFSNLTFANSGSNTFAYLSNQQYNSQPIVMCALNS